MELSEESRIRLIVNSIDSIVWEFDLLTQRFTFVSEQAERLLGYPVSRWIDDPAFWQEHIHPDDRHWAPAFCAANTEKLCGHEFDYRMLASDGRVVWLKDIVSVIVEDGRPVAIRGTMVDITEYKKATAERDDLEKNRQSFLNAAAHELKTPVTIIQGFVELMLRGGELPPNQSRALSSIQKGTNRLTALVNDLVEGLRFHREAEMKVSETNFDLARMLEDLVLGIGATAPRHTLRLETPAPLNICSDSDRLEQAIANVLANAIKYSPMGGDIQVRVKATPETILISVTDQGIGIPQDKQLQIFNVFFRAHAGTKHDYGGLGMGLYLSKKIMTLLGGSLEFDSREDAGSTFRLYLPHRPG